MATAELKQSNRLGPKIDAKRAASAASQYFGELFSGEQHPGIRLEEVELSEDEKFWLITLSFQEKPQRSKVLNMQEVFGPSTLTRYKVFKVNSHTGKVVSMKIRQFE